MGPPDRDELFGDARRGIFWNRELVDISHVPELDRIVGRDEEIRNMGSALAPGTIGAPPESVTIYGKTGTGKSLVVRSTTREAVIEARENGVQLAYAYVDCSDDNTEAQASRAMARAVNDFVDANKNVPRTGYAGSQYRDLTWEILDKNGVDVLIVILDEIDVLDDDTVLRSLSRAKESGKTNTHIGVISISNKIKYRQKVSQRVDSSLQDREYTFEPYDASQLRNILEHRKDAFQDGVLEEGVIPLISAKAAQEHGDARKAVDMLYEAGRIAEKQNASTVTEDFVERAEHRADVNQVKSLISGDTPHARYVLHALAALTLDDDRVTPEFKTSEVYEFYKVVADSHGADPLTRDRITGILDEQAFLDLTENEYTSGGHAQGAFLKHRLLVDPEVVIDATRED